MHIDGFNETFSVAGVNNLTGNFLAGILPIVSLFGKDITNLYLSQSLPYLDWFIFAVGPLGVGWAMIACFKLRGHGTLQSLVGLSSGLDSEIEKELMPSTSSEVTEVWNGCKVIRILETLSMRELLYNPDAAPPYTFQSTKEAKKSGLLICENGKGVEDFTEESDFPPNILLNLGGHRTTYRYLVTCIGVICIGGMFLRRQAEPLLCKRIYGDHEMDWLSLTRELNPEYLHGEGTESEFKWSLCVGSIDPMDTPPWASSLSRTSFSSYPKPRANAILELRENLQRHCKWTSPAEKTAKALHKAIAKTRARLELYLTDDQWNALCWQVIVKTGVSEDLREAEAVQFRMKEGKPCLQRIEAALSLMLFHERQKRGEKDSSLVGPKDEVDLEALEKLNTEETQRKKEKLLLLGIQGQQVPADALSSHMKNVFLIWNAKDNTCPLARIVGFKANRGFSLDKPVKVQKINKISFTDEHDIAIGLDESNDSTLYALHMFSSFMWAVAWAMKQGSSNNVDSRRLSTDLYTLVKELSGDELGSHDPLHWLTSAPFFALGLLSCRTSCTIP
ncbi:hypothetical protein BDV29DRAFT_160794 [Aspergillus leporis]|uniref:Uncharacterized protein n=1 Tax=Aspergillus leporis TaxID=41062 RepID=A0A5N5WSE9_9EURO|nr:hypothetical protein BDV29DRAFT_160794 [Aspergillus leporis]